jgi:protein-L-isoaspartate(D-aspartate) O-methyltransferase
MNFEHARTNMVGNQVRSWEVLDDSILALFKQVHREDFVPGQYKNLALADLNIHLAHGQVMMKPGVEGRMLQSLEIKPDDIVLEIGTGSGYITACLATLAKRVCTVEIYSDLLETAEQKLSAAKIDNIEYFNADVMGDWLPEQAHDVVIVGGSVPVIPDRFKEWVNPGGRLFAIVGDSPVMEAKCLTRVNVTEWTEESLFETDLPALVNSEKAAVFEF